MQNKDVESITDPAPAITAEPGSQARPWWLGIAVILMGCVCLYAASALPATAQYAAIGPGMFVSVVGGGLLLLGILLLIQIARGERFESQDTENAEGNQPMDKRAFITALSGTIVPALTMETLGLPVTAMIAFTLVARAFGSRKTITDLITGAILGSLCWFLFSRLGLQLGGFFPLAGF